MDEIEMLFKKWCLECGIEIPKKRNYCDKHSGKNNQKRRNKNKSLYNYIRSLVKKLTYREKFCDLDKEWILKHINNGICPRTSINLTYNRAGKGNKRSPTNASIHRLDNGKPHTKENCIVVCWWYNNAVAIFDKDEDGFKFYKEVIGGGNDGNPKIGENTNL